MRRVPRALVCVAMGVGLSFPIFAATYYAMAKTSTPHFCSSCHEIQPAYDTWKASTHANNARGLVADCMDCHLPAPETTLAFFFAKTTHGVKDLVLHYVGGPYEREKSRKSVYGSLENDRCTKCHANILHIPERRGAMLAHKTVLYPRVGYEKRCVDCHRNLVHNPTDLYRYSQYSRR